MIATRADHILQLTTHAEDSSPEPSTMVQAMPSMLTNPLLGSVANVRTDALAQCSACKHISATISAATEADLLAAYLTECANLMPHVHDQCRAFVATNAEKLAEDGFLSCDEICSQQSAYHHVERRDPPASTVSASTSAPASTSNAQSTESAQSTGSSCSSQSSCHENTFCSSSNKCAPCSACISASSSIDGTCPCQAQAIITVVQPNQQSSASIGGVLTITWTSTLSSQNLIDIFLLPAGQSTYIMQIAGQVTNTGSLSLIHI